MIDVRAMQQEIYNTAVDKGFWADAYDETTTFEYVVTQKLLLIVSEVIEVMEAIRKDEGIEAIENEFADIVIRVLDLYEGMLQEELVESHLFDAIADKMRYNNGRPKKHGNRF